MLFRIDWRSRRAKIAVSVFKIGVYVILLATLFALRDGVAQPQLSDDSIKRLLVYISVNQYKGSCPCPYSRDKDGRRCGKRSAWSKSGGKELLCFEQDVSDEMVAEYKQGEDVRKSREIKTNNETKHKNKQKKK